MKKIGIVTFHSSHNYGSVFQSYALSRTLMRMGLETKIIDFRHPAAKGKYEFVLWNKYGSLKSNLKNLVYRGLLRRGASRAKAFNDFIEKNLPLTQYYKTRFDIKEHFDYLVCGSDQIWNPVAKDSRDMIYFLDFGDEDSIRFSYAASSGSRKFLDAELPVIKKLLQRMRRVGVREQFMQEYLSSELNVQSTVNPDPSILLKREDWKSLEEPVEEIPQKFLVMYSLLDTSRSVKLAAMVAKNQSLPLVVIDTKLRLNLNSLGCEIYNLKNVTPGQFLWLFRHAQLVVSNSFHGNMFSVIYRKNFLCPRFEFEDTRIDTLHERIGLGTSRFIKEDGDFDFSNIQIDYSQIEDRIEAFRQEGISYLQDCIK